jgi:glucokinase
MKSILAADIGGTNSRFGHFRLERDGALVLVARQWLPTSEAESFARLLEQLGAGDFSLAPEQADLAVIAVAGPVERGTYCAPPHISWDIDLARAAERQSLPRAHLINDFIAQAHACRSPLAKAARPILAGESGAAGTVGVLGAGTALGKAGLIELPDGAFQALPSEGGHAYFPFVSDREFAFQEFFRQKSGRRHITGNLVVSGCGLRYLHWFLAGEELQPHEITGAAEWEKSETLAWFAGFYGRVCRDYALAMLTLGGLYIAGGVAAANPEILGHANFKSEFLDSPTMGHLLAKIPVLLIADQDSGLWGAAFHAQQLLRQR